ncbi:MAG: sterol desaturase family protein [Bacteroidota bacterium]
MNKVFENLPNNLQPRDEGADSLFDNKIIEWFTRTHVSVPIITHVLIILFFVYISWVDVLKGVPGMTFTIYNYLGLLVGGWFFWSLTEYWVHRWLFHVHIDSKFLKQIQHFGHGIHHQFPRDPTRLAMSPIIALFFQLIFLGIFWLVMNSYAFAFFPGFLLGYLTYITLHYFEHTVRPPKFGPLHNLWKSHTLHHYKYPETKGFGISTRLWDFVFGTLPED